MKKIRLVFSAALLNLFFVSGIANGCDGPPHQCENQGCHWRCGAWVCPSHTKPKNLGENLSFDQKSPVQVPPDSKAALNAALNNESSCK